MNRRTSILILMSALSGAACAGGPIPPGSPAPLTGWGTAQVDGDMDTPDRWADAGCISFTATAPIGNVPASACVMNDATNLYVLVVYNGAFWDTISNHAAIHLDETGNWVIDAGDDLWRHYRTPVTPGILDDHWINNSTSGPDANLGGVNDGAAAFGHDGMRAVYEIVHPLDSSTPHDISVALGDTIGALFDLGIAGTLTQVPDYTALVPIIIAKQPEPKPPVCVRLQNCKRVPMRPELIELICDLRPCNRVDELPRNCLLKFPCPICPGGLCPPFTLEFVGLEDDWDLQLVDRRGKSVKHEITRTGGAVRLTFNAPKGRAGAGMPDYAVIFRLKSQGDLNRSYRVATRLVGGTR